MLKAYAAMLPRLQAEESLRNVTITSVATGNTKTERAKSFLTDLRKQVKEGVKAKPADPAMLKSIGIRVEMRGRES